MHLTFQAAPLPTFSLVALDSGRNAGDASVVLMYMSSKELSLGLSSGRPGNVTTNLPGRPAPKTSRKNSFL